MENRFGVKDLFLFGLIAALVITLVLAMLQFDRQYDQVLIIKQQVSEQTNDLNEIKRQISTLSRGGGIAAGPAATQPAQSSGTVGRMQGDPNEYFKHMHEAQQSPGYSRGDWYIDNFGTKIGKLTPFLATDVYQSYIELLVMDTLLGRDPVSLELVPNVASSWEQSADGLKMVFHMRPEVVFSDGTPMTADDIVYTFDWIRNPGVNAARERSYLTYLKDVRALDAHTVEFNFTEPYYRNLLTVGAQAILSKKFYSRFTPDQYNEKVGLMFGSGPYRMEDPENWSPGKLVELLRNERYWGEPPSFNRVVFREVQEEAPRMVMYGNQETDNELCQPEMYNKLKADQRVMAFSNTIEYPSPYRGYNYVAWNQVRKVNGVDVKTPFADKRVRQAMTMLLDRDRMIKEIFLGYGTVATGPFAPASPQTDPSVKPLPFDVEGAKKLLADAGFYDRNGDGVVDGPDGKPLRFTLLYPSGSDMYEKMVRFFKDSLARGGVAMDLDRQDWPVLVEHLNKSDFDSVTLGWSGTPESDPYQIFHSSQIGDQGDNRTNYVNKELDEVIEKARKTVDTDARMKLWNRAHAILAEDQPYTFLANRPFLRIMNNRIKNVKTTAAGLNYEYLNGGTIPWFVPVNEQKYTQ